MNVRIAAFSMAGALALASTGASAVIDDKKAQEVMNKSGCAACHQVDKKLVGPAYKEIARKHKGQKGAAEALVKKVRSGGAGVYGQISMPPQSASQISDADLKAMVEWVLSK